MKRFILSALLILCEYGPLFSQINVNTGATPAQIVGGIFGPEYIVSNITINSATDASGTFSNGNTTNLGLTSGTVLTTGSALTINNSAQSFSAAFNNLPGDPLITAFTNRTSYDACIVEFDIIPPCSTMSVNYVFGSEEYPEWANTPYDDAFGMFISGPNPAGGNYSNLNIAVLPNTNVPISVNTVNSGVNAGYYINNQASTSIVYDGLTVKFNASASVVSCATYHVKIVIADGSDYAYDSGVFFEKDTPSCPPPAITAGEDRIICPGSSVVLSATIGADNYTWSPSTGLSTTSGPVVVASPTVTTTYAVFAYMGCMQSQGAADSITVFVVPAPNLSIIPQNPIVDIGESITITASGALHYEWLPTGDTTASITISPDIPTTYTVIGTNDLAEEPCIDTLVIFVDIGSPLYVPNTFTPNGDGLNDVFIPKGGILEEIDPDDYDLMIFDRWGNLIFETQDINTGWDGRLKDGSLTEIGVYAWRIQTKAGKEPKIGRVNLIR